MRLRMLDQFCDALRRDGRMDDQHVGHRRDDRDGREVPCHIVGHAAVEGWIDGEVSGRRQNQHVTVGRGLGAKLHADVPSGAGAIVDDDRFSQTDRELIADETGERIGRTTGRERHDQS